MTIKRNQVDPEALAEIHSFLGCETPDRWIENALVNQEIMLVDHAHCEKKAAMTAINMIHRYPDDAELLMKMSRLAREELRHFEQVLKFIKQRKMKYTHMTASRYATSLRNYVRKNEPEKIVDLLIIGAFIEARSCERFNKLAPHLDEKLKEFYISLLKSEARHYQDYLKLAGNYTQKIATKKRVSSGSEKGVAKTSGQAILKERVAFFRDKEIELILAPDTEFRFHSGPVLSAD